MLDCDPPLPRFAPLSPPPSRPLLGYGASRGPTRPAPWVGGILCGAAVGAPVGVAMPFVVVRNLPPPSDKSLGAGTDAGTGFAPSPDPTPVAEPGMMIPFILGIIVLFGLSHRLRGRRW